MKKILFIHIILIFVGQLSCQELLFEGGIYIEKPNNLDTSLHRYSHDNISYILNRTFIYDYYYLDNTGVKKKFLLKKDWSFDNPMNLTKYENPSESVIDKIKLVVDDNLKIFSIYDSTYTQTVFSYYYINGKISDTLFKDFHNGIERTGVIDNKKNLWIHPPRNYSFMILELSPFPFYYLDESVDSWSWDLEVGGFYLDQRWIHCEKKENLKIKYNYTRMEDELVNTPFGNIKCNVTYGTATSKYDNTFMKTHLKSYYNSMYGFVKLEYTNINNSKIYFNLVEVEFK